MGRPGDLNEESDMKQISCIAAISLLCMGTAGAQPCQEAIAELDESARRVGLHLESTSIADELDRDKIAQLRRAAEILGEARRERACIAAVDQAQQHIRSLAAPVVIRSERILGQAVIDSDGKEIGIVDDLIFDMTEQVAAYALIRFGGFLGLGEELIPVPFSALTLSDDGERLLLKVTPSQLESAPRYDHESLVGMANRRWSRAVFRFYGEDPYWITQAKRTKTLVERLRSDVQDIRKQQIATAASRRKQASSRLSSSDATEQWRAEVQSQLAELSEQMTLTQKIMDDVDAIRAADQQVSREEIMTMLHGLNRQVRNMGTLIVQQQQQITAYSRTNTNSAIGDDNRGSKKSSDNATRPQSPTTTTSIDLTSTATSHATRAEKGGTATEHTGRDLGEAGGGGEVQQPESWGSEVVALSAAGPNEKNTDSAIEALFQNLDVDGSGYLNQVETQSDFVIYKHRATLDVNEDGRLDSTEFGAIKSMAPEFDSRGSLLTLTPRQ